jgi:hypothetical protein
MLPQQLLVDYGAKVRIKIYADDVSAEDKQVEENMSSPTQLATNCLSRTKYKSDDYTGHILYTEDICYYYFWPLITMISSASFGAMRRPRSQFGSRLRALNGALSPCAAAAADLGTPGPISRLSSSADRCTGPRYRTKQLVRGTCWTGAPPAGVWNRRRPKSANGCAPRSGYSPAPRLPREPRTA